MSATREQVRDEWLMAQANDRTRETYGYAIRSWFAFLDGRGVDWKEARRVDADTWRVGLARKLAPTTVARYLATAASFYRHAITEYEPAPLLANPFDRVKRPRVEKVSHADGLSAEEARTLLAAAEASDLRLASLCWLLLGTAARISEIVNATVHDLGWADGVRALMVVRKGGVQQPVKIQPNAWSVVERYLSERPPVSDGWLLATTGGRKMTRQWAYQLVRNHAARTLERNVVIGPHDLRHTAITLALDAGMSLAEARALAGHANAATTEHYDRRAHTRGGQASAALDGLYGGGRGAA